MKPFYLLENVIRDYAWGHLHDIPDFLGIEYPEGLPAAELWMGAHPGAPSKVVDENRQSVNLNDLISADPRTFLGNEVDERYGRLPFLFKLLAAGKSLSIQAHPDKQSAQEGFERENREGIPLDSPVRNYRDDNHKPEIMMALTTFSAMIGFRSPAHIAGRFRTLQAAAGIKVIAEDLLEALTAGDEPALKEFLRELLDGERASVNALLESAVLEASAPEGGSGAWSPLEREWVARLAAQFPGDVGALAPLFLNVVEMKPGQALYQPARALHAYLSGFGMELMANSDNVLRGGLTPKNVDVPELLNNLDFEEAHPAVLEAEPAGNGLSSYRTPAREFSLSISTIVEGEPREVPGAPGPRIAIILEGTPALSCRGDELKLQKGMSIFVPPGEESLVFEGTGRVAWAGVPTGSDGGDGR